MPPPNMAADSSISTAVTWAGGRSKSLFRGNKSLWVTKTKEVDVSGRSMALGAMTALVGAALFGAGFWLGRVATLGPWSMMGTHWMMTGPTRWGGWMLGGMWLIPVLLVLGLVVGLVILAVGLAAGRPQASKEQGKDQV